MEPEFSFSKLLLDKAREGRRLHEITPLPSGEGLGVGASERLNAREGAPSAASSRFVTTHPSPSPERDG